MKFKYKAVEDKKGECYKIVDETSFGIPSGREMPKSTPNLKEGELKITNLSVEGCPKPNKGSCISLLYNGRISCICDHFGGVDNRGKTMVNKSHAFVVCEYPAKQQ